MLLLLHFRTFSGHFRTIQTFSDSNMGTNMGRREGDSTMNQSKCIRNTDNSQKLFRATQILFGATHVEFPTPRSEVSKTCFMSYLILKVNSVDYHNAIGIDLCKVPMLWN